MNEVNLDRIAAYLDNIDAHFLKPAISEAVAASCTATCLLLFSAADALGGIYHPDDQAGNRKRFEWTMSRLGNQYQASVDALWALRNTLVHDAMHSDTFLSHIEDWEHRHLGKTTEGQILINTRQMTSDFATLLENLRRDATSSNCDASIADSRLEWTDKIIQPYSESTPPPPFTKRFVKAKSRSPANLRNAN